MTNHNETSHKRKKKIHMSTCWQQYINAQNIKNIKSGFFPFGL